MQDELPEEQRERYPWNTEAVEDGSPAPSSSTWVRETGSSVSGQSRGSAERDLMAQAAGFGELHLEHAFLIMSPHPLAPPLSLILAAQFSAEERQVFEKVMRPLVEDTRAIATDRAAYLTARKPTA